MRKSQRGKCKLLSQASVVKRERERESREARRRAVEVRKGRRARKREREREKDGLDGCAAIWFPIMGRASLSLSVFELASRSVVSSPALPPFYFLLASLVCVSNCLYISISFSLSHRPVTTTTTILSNFGLCYVCMGVCANLSKNRRIQARDSLLRSRKMSFQVYTPLDSR